MPTDRPVLVGGPYRTPTKIKASDLADCRQRGQVVVDGLTEGARTTKAGRLAWPYIEPCRGTGKYSLVLMGDLVAALETESSQAVAWYWGVSRWQVGRWRRLLGIGRMTPGTVDLWRSLAPTKLDHDARSRGGIAATTGRGKPPTP